MTKNACSGVRPAFRVALLASAGLSALSAIGAQAQTSPVAALTTHSRGVEEVVVTAQRRQERLQNVPIAVTAVSSAQLARAGVTNTADLANVTPSLEVTTAIGVYTQPVIRSVGTSSHGPGIENPIATYIDGVYLVSATASLMTLYDISQVAVLKGPQGTLFGRNATGGLIQVTTRQPTQQFHADVEATVGNKDTFNQALYVNGGITPTLAGNLAVTHEDQAQGFGKNFFDNQWVGAYHSFAARGKLLWQPDALTYITLSADYSRRAGSDIDLRVMGKTVLDSTVPGTPWDVDNNVQSYETFHGAGTSLTAKRDFNAFQVVSITAYRRDSAYNDFDPDTTPLPLLQVKGTQTDDQFSQELQFLSSTSQRLTWVAGLYFLDADSGDVPNATVSDFGSPEEHETTALSLVRSYAGFAQSTYKIDPATNLTLGIRYTLDQRHLSYGQTDNFAGTIYPAGQSYFNPATAIDTGNAEADKTFAQPSWRISLDHRFSEQLMAYVSYNHGFRSGSFDPNQLPIVTLKPEVIDAYETGFKSDLWDRRLRIDAAAYYYEYHNRQVQTIINGVEFDYDAKRSHTYGIDGDVTANVTDQLSVTAGFSATRAVYTDFNNAFLSVPLPAGGNYLYNGSATGKTIENTPAWTLNIDPTYRIPSAFGDFTVDGGFYHNGGFFGDPGNRTRQNPYNTLAASVSWVPAFALYLSLRAWGRNLANTAYATQIQPTNYGDDFNMAPGRTFGLTVGAHF